MDRRLSSLTLIALGLASMNAIAEEEKVLNIYNWSDYIAEDTVANFEELTGIKVNYDVYDSNDVLEAKMLSGSSGYDITVPTGDFLNRQIQAGVYQKLDKSKLPNLKNMDPEIMASAAQHDPDNAHSIVYMWGTNGFGYNVNKVAEAMPDAPVNSFDMLFDPAVVEKLSACGVSMLDSPSEVVPSILNYLGLDPTSKNVDDLPKVEEVLMSVRPFIRYFHSSQYINDLANGDTCVAMGFSGDILQARDRASEADNGVEIAYVIPSEGAQQWFDMLAIPADAPHPENAHAFINYIMEPQVAADITNYVYYANANTASFDLIDKEVTQDPGIYPSEEVKKKLFPTKADPVRYTRALTRMWTKVKTGQ